MNTNPIRHRVRPLLGILSEGCEEGHLSTPVASQVLREISLLIAAHLAVAFAIVLTLQTMGIGD